MRWFKPLLTGATWRERVVGCAGAFVCLALTMIVSSPISLSATDLPAIVAPLGASAVLVFAVPSSPLAQPWSVLGGNIISSLIGVAVAQAVPHVALAAGLAVGLAILVMSLLRCLHPPGGAAALTAVVGSAAIHDAGYAFAFAPVGINSVALVALAMLFHRATGHRYPHRPAVSTQPMQAAELVDADIDAALADMHESFDIARDDLEALIARARLHARARVSSSTSNG
ncbi:HPP family protein [Sphingomonas sp.]|uniref:HPP family protein n=1 Tax=Sphingomonas sp. TaxID=28214 RepID=UPI002CD3AEBA|nr:HPP family protein [Sphingomonas sp.]HTG37231.1 HPP family protein [Sphingomonas sp.]